MGTLLLDVRTLIITGTTMALAGGMILALLSRISPYRGPGHWTAAVLTAGLGTGLIALRGMIPDWLSIIVANTLFLWTFTAVWSGARAFATQKPVSPLWAIAATLPFLPVMWLITTFGDVAERTILIMSVTAVPLFGAAVELMRRGGPPLITRTLLALALFCQGAVHLFRLIFTPLIGTQPLLSGGPLLELYFLEAMLFIPIATLLFAAVIAELAMRTVRDRAIYDPEGNHFNAAGFMMVLDKELARGRRETSPAALLMVGLDRSAAPAPLRATTLPEDEHRFRSICATTLREQDTLGRLEAGRYAVLLPNTELEDALRIAHRLRAAFTSTWTADGRHAVRTLSLGAACAMAGVTTRDALLATASEALERASRSGGDRVERASVPTLADLAEPSPA